jgi:glycosyltransferase involved in cell wall biosynthesis
MKIGILSPSIYMSPTRYSDMIFAPRELAVALADGLVDRGHEVWFFTAPDVKTKAKLIAGDNDLLFHEFTEGKLKSGQSERLKWASFYGVKRNYEMDLTEKCYRTAKAEHFDVIHSYHDYMAHFFDGISEVPTVYTLHDPLPADPGDISFWLLSKFSQHKYISISNTFRKSEALKLNFIGTVYHGINLTDYPYTEKPQNYLMAMGRMVPEKGLDDAIDVAADGHMPLRIATSDMDVNTHMPFYTGVIEPKMAGNTLVSFTGFLDGVHKAENLGGARAFLFPIKWEEPFGMVMIEAAACGTPVIAYAHGSVPEIVKDGVTGFIVNEKDTDATDKNTDGTDKQPLIIRKTGVAGLAEAISRIGEIDRAACRKHVEENFTVEKMVMKHEELYRKVSGL